MGTSQLHDPPPPSLARRTKPISPSVETGQKPTRRTVYFGQNQSRPVASARSLLPVGVHARRRDRAEIGRKTPAFLVKYCCRHGGRCARALGTRPRMRESRPGCCRGERLVRPRAARIRSRPQPAFCDPQFGDSSYLEPLADHGSSNWPSRAPHCTSLQSSPDRHRTATWRWRKPEGRWELTTHRAPAT
jgi:hypothetical protein